MTNMTTTHAEWHISSENKKNKSWRDCVIILDCIESTIYTVKLATNIFSKELFHYCLRNSIIFSRRQNLFHEYKRSIFDINVIIGSKLLSECKYEISK